MHYYKKNIGDYYKKAGRLSMLEHGAYTLLIDSCYDREKFPTLDEAIEWAWARTTEEINAVKFILERFFELQDGFYVQTRIQEELNKYHENAQINARIAQEREEKRRERKRTEHEPCTHGDESVNEPPPNHKPLTNNQEPYIQDKPVKFVFKNELIKMGAEEKLASEWLVVRKNKKASNTETAFNTFVSQVEKSGLDVNTVLKICIVKSWSGFNRTWVKPEDIQEHKPVEKQKTPVVNYVEVEGLW